MEFERIIVGASKWFDQRLNRSDLFGEAALIIAVGEQIDDDIRLKPEKDFKFVTNDDKCPGGYFNYDLVGLIGCEPTLKPKYLFEMKYLKQSKESDVAAVAYERIVDDLFKLASPPASDLERYLVLGRPKNTRLPERVQNLLDSSELEVCLCPQSGTSNAGCILSPSTRLLSSVEALKERLQLPRTCTINCVSGISQSDNNSTTLSIFRINRPH